MHVKSVSRLFVYLDELQTGRVNISTSELMSPGGKGINVSRVLKTLGCSGRALGFLGGFTGDFIEQKLKEEDIDSDFISVPGATRINMKLKAAEETEINGMSPEINGEATRRLFEKVHALSAGDALVLSGSVPRTVCPDIYKEILEKAVRKGVLTVVDTKGDPLKAVFSAKPFLIKPNHHELGDLVGADIDSVEKAEQYARELVKMGAENVIISMAGRGAVLVNRETALHASVPKGKVVNSVGAGDSVVAGFIASYTETGNIQKAFQYGIASGSASAFSNGFCTTEKIESLLNQVDTQLLRGKS